MWKVTVPLYIRLNYCIDIGRNSLHEVIEDDLFLHYCIIMNENYIPHYNQL